MYDFVEGTICLQLPETDEDFYQSAVGFGTFQQLLTDFPAAKLHETIPNFHNTPDRYRALLETLERDPMHRAAQVQSACSHRVPHHAHHIVAKILAALDFHEFQGLGRENRRVVRLEGKGIHGNEGQSGGLDALQAEHVAFAAGEGEEQEGGLPGKTEQSAGKGYHIGGIVITAPKILGIKLHRLSPFRR